MLGVNLSGAEFGGSGDKYGWDYKYPTLKDLAFYADKGITLFRLPVKWERLQPTAGGELDKAELGRLLEFLDNAQKVGGKIIVDIHNFGRYDGKAIGSKDVPIKTFADFWSKLASAIGDKVAVYGYDLMNEPHGMPSKTTWPDAAQAATDAIRALGDTHAIFVEGEAWAGAANWAAKNPFLKVNDPLDNIVYEAHLYFDKDASGTYKGSYDAEKASADLGEKRLKSFVSLLDANNAKGFIGEFGVPSDDQRWQVVLDNFLNVMNRHGLSGTYWGAGSWFNGYNVGLLDKAGNPKASLETLLAHVSASNNVGVGSDVDTELVALPKLNTAPVAANDVLKIVSGESGTGNVLTNDTDANKDALTATLKTGPAHGTVTLAADGSYIYKAVAGYSGTDSFIYTASDGTASSTATVALTVKPAPIEVQSIPAVLTGLLERAGTLDGTASSSNTLTGIKGHNTFYFDLEAKSGTDRITNFERDDILVLKGMLNDNNGDGIINFSKNKLSLGDMDKVTMKGVSSLRYLGTDDEGLSVYANAAVKPKGAIEGTIGDDTLGDTATAAKKSVFFYDTSLDIHLGDDKIVNFDSNDLFVTTTALSNTKLDNSGTVTLTGASGSLGTVDFNAVTVGALEFDGSVTRSGVTYYVYSQEGSSVGIADLTF
jgi:VCBS repeat-containing protein